MIFFDIDMDTVTSFSEMVSHVIWLTKLENNLRVHTVFSAYMRKAVFSL